MSSFDATYYGTYAAWGAVVLSSINTAWAIWKEYVGHKSGLRVYAFIKQKDGSVLLKYYLYAENANPIMVKDVSLIAYNRFIPKKIVSKFSLYKQVGGIRVELLDVVDSNLAYSNEIVVTSVKSDILDKIINNLDYKKLMVIARTSDDKLYFGNIDYNNGLKFESLGKTIIRERSKQTNRAL